MPLTIGPIQFANAAADLNPTPSDSGTLTISATFGSNNQAGNTLLAFVSGYSIGAETFVDNFAISDSQGNTWTNLIGAGTGNLAGPGFAIFMATNCKAGANTVTASMDWGRSIFIGSDVVNLLQIAEYSLPNPTLQASNYWQVYGAGGNAPITLNFTDSHSASVAVQFASIISPYGPGSISSGVIVDLVSAGVNYPIGFVVGNGSGAITGGSVTTTPSGYANFVLENTAGPQSGSLTTLSSIWLDPGSITLTLAIAANPLNLAWLCTGFYQSLLYATGGTPPYTFSITAGSLPPGLSLDPSSGVISGTTQDQPGTYNFTATVTDSTSATDSLNLSLALQDGYGVTDPQIILQVSDDGGKTWSNERSTSLGAIGQYRTLVRWRRLGRSNNRVFRVICSEAVDVSLVAADLDVE